MSQMLKVKHAHCLKLLIVKLLPIEEVCLTMTFASCAAAAAAAAAAGAVQPRVLRGNTGPVIPVQHVGQGGINP